MTSSLARRLRSGLGAGALLLVLFGAGSATAQDGTVRFEGNEAIEEARLREAVAAELEDYEQKGHRRADIDDAAWELENFYRREGYAFAEVRYRYEKEDEEPAATFLIVEGPRVLLGSVNIEGSHAVPEETLRAFITAGDSLLFTDKPHYVVKEINEATRLIRDYYYGEGYVQAVVDPPRTVFNVDRTRAHVTISVREGPRHFIRQVVLSGDLHEEMGPKLDALTRELEGEVFHRGKRNVLRSRIAAIFAGAGYPDAEVRVAARMVGTPGDVLLEAAIWSGPRVRVRETVVRGQRKTRTGLIRKQIDVRPGEWYDWNRVAQSIDDINRLGIFSSVKTSFAEEELLEERTLVFTVEEAPSRELLLEAGWGSYEKARGRIGYREKNLFGMALHAGAVVGGSLKSRHVGANIADPTFLGTEVMANFPVEYREREEPTFTEESLEGSFVLLRRLEKHLNVSARYGFQITDIGNVEASEPDPNLEERYNLTSLRFRIGRSTKDDLFYPSSGSEGSVSLEYASPRLGGDISYFRFTFASGLFHGFGKDTVLALRLETGLLMPTDEDTSIPLAERFFNGGESTVRSFPEAGIGPKDAEGDSLGGLGYNILSIELRRRLKGNFAASLFVDAGNVMPNRSRVEEGLPPFENATDAFDEAVEDYFGDIRTGVGVGLQYLLPVGPARLDVAVNPDPREGEDRWIAHFTLGMAF